MKSKLVFLIPKRLKFWISVSVIDDGVKISGDWSKYIYFFSNLNRNADKIKASVLKIEIVTRKKYLY